MPLPILPEPLPPVAIQELYHALGRKFDVVNADIRRQVDGTSFNLNRLIRQGRQILDQIKALQVQALEAQEPGEEWYINFSVTLKTVFCDTREAIQNLKQAKEFAAVNRKLRWLPWFCW
jgi:hypothetical protein